VPGTPLGIQLVEREIARAKGLPPPQGLVGRRPDGQRMDYEERAWPPPRVNLPDELLGPAVNVPFVLADAPTLGSANAPVTVVYLNDYDAMGGARGKVIVDGLRKAYGDGVRIVARPSPSSRSQNGQVVAEAAWAAHAQGRFWPFHDKLLTVEAPRDRAGLEKSAGALGLDVDEFRAALDDGRARKTVEDDVALHRQAGFTSRPAFLVNGRRAEGMSALVQLVEAGLKKAGKKVTPVGRAPAPPDRDGMRGVAELTGPQSFFVEPRDDAWATAVEKQLGPVLASDVRTLDPKASAFRFDCKSVYCRLRWRQGKETRAVDGYVQAVYGSTAGPHGPQDGQLYLRVGDKRQAEADVKRFLSRRAAFLFNVRTGRAPVPPGLEAARMPKE
jgi:hypothetical protein